jgi:hypothetical protein
MTELHERLHRPGKRNGCTDQGCTGCTDQGRGMDEVILRNSTATAEDKSGSKPQNQNTPQN